MNKFDRVGFETIKTSSGLEFSNHQAIVNLDTKKPIAIVSKRYKIIPNQKLLEVICPSIEALNLPRVSPIITTARNGTITFFKFLWESIKGEIQVGDIIKYGVEFFNSYDGSLKFGFHIIALRLKCTNGLAVPQSVTYLSLRHTQNHDVSMIKSPLFNFLAKTKTATEQWSTWSKTQFPNGKVSEFLKQNFGKKVSLELEKEYKAKPEKEQTVWEFYNVMTQHLSHNLKSRIKDRVPIRQFYQLTSITNRLSDLVNTLK